VKSAPLALTGEEFVDLLEDDTDDPEDGFDFDEHDGSGCEWETCSGAL
jgi:hypothetical protein